MSTITPLQGLVVSQIEEARAERLFVSFGGVMDESEVFRVPLIPTSVDLETYRSQLEQAQDLLAEYRSGAGIRSLPAQRKLVRQYGDNAESVTKGIETKSNEAYKTAMYAFYAASGAAALVGTSLTVSERKYRNQVLDPQWGKFEVAAKQAKQTKRASDSRRLRSVRTGH